MKKVDVLIIGAGASGLMCAIEAGKRKRKVLLVDHANKAGKKILMSGGGRCNFTNYDVSAENFISSNPHFCKSGLSRFTQWDFIDMVCRHNIPYHERDHGQLFCNDSAKDILNMLLDECKKVSIEIQLKTVVGKIEQLADNHFIVTTNNETIECHSLVIATGGLSIPKMSATPFGYRVAEQFGINIIPTSAGLVPFTLQPEDKERFMTLSGIAVDSIVSHSQISFRENILFTHRGLSGPAILQISSYWKPGEEIIINLLPDHDLLTELLDLNESHAKKNLKTCLSQLLPKRVVETLLNHDLLALSIADMSHKQKETVSNSLQRWVVRPNGTEGYRTAEVTLGGVDCHQISSKTFEANEVMGLFFIGEVLDVTGWLGGYNFQWAWSSGWCAGQYV